MDLSLRGRPSELYRGPLSHHRAAEAALGQRVHECARGELVGGRGPFLLLAAAIRSPPTPAVHRASY